MFNDFEAGEFVLVISESRNKDLEEVAVNTCKRGSLGCERSPLRTCGDDIGGACGDDAEGYMRDDTGRIYGNDIENYLAL